MHALAISAITEGELLYGLAKRGYPDVLSAKVRAFLSRVEVLPWTSEVAAVYADLRAACESGGTPLAPLDMMIAAHAKAHGLLAAQSADDVVLVTRDRAFARVPGGLRLEDWTS